MSNIQSIIFKLGPPYNWNISESKNWLRSHNFIYKKVDITSNYLRFRQFYPKKEYNYITKKISNGISLIILVP